MRSAYDGCDWGCSAVPAFNSIVGLVGALLGTIVSMQTMALMWLHDYNLDRRAGMTVKHWGASLCWAIFAIGSFILVGGVSLILINSFVGSEG